MEHLLTIHETDIYPDTKYPLPADRKIRNAARAVVINERGQIALLHATTHSYHKLPGGGVESGEDMIQALQRELLEEVGCHAEIIAEIGEIIEYRNKWGLEQTSHCYLAKQVGELQPPQFTQSEIDEGFEIVWADSIQVAITLLKQDTPQNYDGRFIQRRDIRLLEAAEQI